MLINYKSIIEYVIIILMTLLLVATNIDNFLFFVGIFAIVFICISRICQRVKTGHKKTR